MGSNKFLQIFIGILFSIFIPLGARAATLYLLPQSQIIHQGETFLIEVRLDTEGEEINAIEGNINLPLDLLEFIDFSKGESILSLWVKEPGISDNLLSFIGGIPGGFKGEEKIGRIILKGKMEGKGEINFKEGSKVLLNDPLGTPAKLSTFGANFTILAEKLEAPRDQWLQELEKDKIPPEPFEIKIGKSPEVFEGKYFIAFSTIDKQTGIDHYEIKEGKRDWKRGESPYLLVDQSLRNKILVKALDKAGNERMAEIIPPYKVTWKDIIPWIILAVIIGLVIWRLIIKKQQARRSVLRNF